MRGRFRIVDTECMEVLRALLAAFTEEGLRFALEGVIQSGITLDDILLRELMTVRPERFDVFLSIRERLVGDG